MTTGSNGHHRRLRKLESTPTGGHAGDGPLLQALYAADRTLEVNLTGYTDATVIDATVIAVERVCLWADWASPRTDDPNPNPQGWSMYVWHAVSGEWNRRFPEDPFGPPRPPYLFPTFPETFPVSPPGAVP